MADNSDAKSIDSWGGGTYATMQSTLVPMAHGERIFTCPKHGGQYDDRNALCRDCEQEFYEKRSALKEQQALVQQKLQELGTAADSAGSNAALEPPPPIALVHQEHRPTDSQHQQIASGMTDSAPPVETLQWSNPPHHRPEEKGLDKPLDAQPQGQLPAQIQTHPMYDLQPQQQQQSQQQAHQPPMYSSAASTPVNNTPIQMGHPQTQSPQIIQNMFHAQQPQLQPQQQQQQQQHHPSTAQPSPTSHSLPPRYPGMMGLSPSNPMQNHIQQQPPPQQQQTQPHSGNPHHHVMQQSHTVPTAPMSQPPPGPASGSTPLGAPPSAFWSSPPQSQLPNAPPVQFDALTMQIQRMQQMQDWMIWQKENENATLKQQLEQAQSELNQLRLDNVLLTEKLHQQEQRMQQELKLIKMAALQSRQHRKIANQEKQIVLVQQQQQPTPAVSLMPNATQNGSWQGFEDPAFFQPDFMPSSSVQSSEDNAQQQNLGKKQSGGNMSTSDSNNATNSSHSLQQPQLVEAYDESVGTGNSMGENLSDEGKDEFDSNSITWPANTGDANSASGRSRASKTQQQKNAYKRKVGPLTSRATELATSSPRRNNATDMGNQALRANTNDTSHHESMVEQVRDAEPRQVDGSHQISDLDEYSLEAASIPQDIGFDDRVSQAVPLEETIAAGNIVPSLIQHHNNLQQVVSTSANANETPFQGQSYPTTPPRPTFATNDSLNNTSNGLPRNLPPRSPGANIAARSTSPPKPKSPKAKTAGVSFVDDNASVGHTVASSTFGEDRIKAQKQTIMDPYGDKGEYTGIILRSTGMPHGYGEMVYHEDKRTYAGEWRHGRWHGFGR